MTVLICDDEQRVCALIERLIDWDKLGLTLAGTACDGCEALAMIQKEKPDIVVTDIRMPGLDGLELIRHAREAGLSCRFIIVSGYQHFSYAHLALRYGVAEYLLKPIRQEELNHCLREVCRTAAQPPVSSPVELHRHFMGNLLFGSCPEGDFDLDHVNGLCGLAFENSRFAVLALRPDTAGTPGPPAAVMEDALNRVSAKCRVLFDESVCLLHSNFVFAVVNDDFDKGLAPPAQVLHAALAQWGAPLGLTVTVGVGRPCTMFSGIVASMQEAVECLKCRLSIGLGRVIHYEALGFSGATLEELLGHDWRGRWALAMESMEPELVSQALAGLFESMAAGKQADPRLYYELCAHLIASAFAPPYTGDAATAREEQEKTIKLQLLECSRVECLQRCMDAWLCARVEQYLSLRQSRDRLPIRRAKRYIKENYRAQITLEDVAREVHFNPNYLSSLFKSEVGINFGEYLVQVRIEAAKALLRDDKCGMEQVAEQVGYQNAKYFTRLFRKATGITPSKYRSMYS